MIYLIATVTALCVCISPFPFIIRYIILCNEVGLCICLLFFVRGVSMELFSLSFCLFVVLLSVVHCIVILIQSHVYYGLWKLKELTHMSYPLYFTYYALWQCFYVMFNVYIIWNSIIPYNFINMLIISPLTSVLPLMLLVVFALKGHSFIFTNYGLEKQSTEHVPNSFGHFCYFMYY